MTLIDSAGTSGPRSSTLRGVALLAAAGMVAAISLLAIPISAQAATAAALHPSAAVPAVAVGKLAPKGCTANGTTPSCDLYAMKGTTSMNGGAPIDIWGFSTTGGTGTATAPGPLLVVHQGDTVTFTLHNQLPDQHVSLAFPGQPIGAFSAAGSTGLSTQAEEIGVATGATSAYTFTAARAGTFVYEAGHTANGARQVAMGLAGALVVLAPDGSAYGPPAAGYPSTASDDEAVVVLSEIDPALNANPAGFDMRDFAPKYRLINGKPFPATDPIGTDQSHRLLLRYVNVGSQTHSMSLLGNDQTQVALDGHAMKYADTQVSAEILPGSTVDTIVSIPSGADAKYALYESAGRLDNNGQTTTIGGLSLAFGGMLTFLDTNAPAPSGDGVGPVPSHVAASPNPSNGLGAVTVTADLSDATTGSSNVDRAEIVIDDASPTGLAPGFGIPMNAFPPAVIVVGARGTIPQTTLTALPAGKHTVFVRAHDSAGNWGVVSATIFNLPKTGPQTTNGSATPSPANGSLDVAISATGDDSTAGGTINGAEYFLDTVGANGSGTVITPNRTAMVVSEDPVIPAATVLALGEGMHHVFVHSHDSLGLWGPPLDISLPVDLTGPGVDGADVKPNPTNGVLTSLAHPGYLVVSATITDANSNGLQNAVTDAEGFLDTVGAGGTGFQLAAVDGAMDSSTESVFGLIPISQVRSLTNGTHHVSVRGQDTAGNWGSLFTMNLVVDKGVPVLGAAVGSPNPTNGATELTLTAPINKTTIAVAEFWLGTTDPGVGHGTVVAFGFNASGSSIMATVPLLGIPTGAQRFNLRVMDLAGNWSNAVNTTVTVSRPNAIFSDGFSSGLTAWSSSTGGPSVTAAAGIPNGGANSGLQATLAGNGTNANRYVTDLSPTAETSYHASFAFNANTLTTNANANTALTLFEARTATAQVLAVQFHRTSTGVNQIRTVMSRSAGGALTGAWVNLPAGVHTIRVDWTSGPATGATAGSLRLQLDGVVVSTQTGNTSTLRVETARLGLTAGVTTASTMSGTAYFDSFVSTRYTLP